jgi:hypothetical protein
VKRPGTAFLKLRQAMSFDAIGAALLRIASWTGEPPAAGSRFHPAAFI